MKIQEKDFYYGAVLTQIAEHPVFTSINKVTEKDGLYLVNDTKRLLIKYSSADGPEWKFTFRKDDFEVGAGHEFFFALVCGDSTICLLNEDDVPHLLNPETEASQWISVTYPSGGQMRVKGTLGSLKRTVPHNAFPQDLLGPVPKMQEPFAWPSLSKLNLYNGPPNLIVSSEERLLDLADTIGHRVSHEKSTTIYFGLTTLSTEWKAWTEKNLRAIEKAIKYDLNFDGFNVAIERFTNPICPYTKKKDRHCSTEFVWKLEISED